MSRIGDYQQRVVPGLASSGLMFLALRVIADFSMPF